MITRDEVEIKAQEFEIHEANVERDYIFGWLLTGIYTISELKNILILKGGNCLRKGYFINTRFSNDLDFSTQSAIEETFLLGELNKVCDFIQSATGVVFEKGRNKVVEELIVDTERKVYQAKLYFKDFYGNPETITISVRLDVTEFDKIYLPIQSRFLIHPYSDVNQCKAEIRCLKLEEILATKLKCLLQRRHSFDLYDYVYSIFINREIDVQRSEIISVFLKKTIFEPDPAVVKNILLELPFEFFRGIWHKYIVCPKISIIDFDFAVQNFKQNIEELFGSFVPRYSQFSYFPANLRNPIIESGFNTNLLAVVYDGVRRIVEPYSLTYKRRKDGVGQEYFYAYDRTGGRTSGPGIKCFINTKIESIESLPEKFTPRFPIELSKAGELGGKTYFGSPFITKRSSYSTLRKPRNFGGYKSGITYIFECSYCGRKFRKSKYDTKLGEHKDKYKNRCYGRIGYLVDQR